MEMTNPEYARKFILKQQFEGFSYIQLKGLHKGYDKVPKSSVSVRNSWSRIKGNQDNRRRDAWNSGTKDGSRTGKKEDSKALVTIDGEESYANLKKLYDSKEQLSEQARNKGHIFKVFKKVEAQLVLQRTRTTMNVNLRFWSDAPIIEKETVKNQYTHSQKPKVDKKELGYGFTVRACFICGSLNHLIRDCDFHEKRMARKAELNNGWNKKSSQRELRETWNNVQRVNKQNQFVPSSVLTRTGKIPVSTDKSQQTKNSHGALDLGFKVLWSKNEGTDEVLEGQKGSRGNIVMPELHNKMEFAVKKEQEAREKREGPREEEQVFMDELERLKRQEKEANEEAEALRKEVAQETETWLYKKELLRLAGRKLLAQVEFIPADKKDEYRTVDVRNKARIEAIRNLFIAYASSCGFIVYQIGCEKSLPFIGKFDEECICGLNYRAVHFLGFKVPPHSSFHIRCIQGEFIGNPHRKVVNFLWRGRLISIGTMQKQTIVATSNYRGRAEKLVNHRMHFKVDRLESQLRRVIDGYCEPPDTYIVPAIFGWDTLVTRQGKISTLR
ncbi:hypothetical protein Tco_1274192 [Tanacetum coccineum]